MTASLNGKVIDYKAEAAKRKAQRSASVIPVFDTTAVTVAVDGGPDGLIYTAGRLNAFGIARLNEYRALADRQLKTLWITDDKGYFVFADDEDEIEWGIMATYIRDYATPVIGADYSQVLSFDMIMAWDKAATLEFLTRCRAAVFELNPTLDPNYLQKMAGNAQPETRTEAGEVLTEAEAELKN